MEHLETHWRLRPSSGAALVSCIALAVLCACNSVESSDEASEPPPEVGVETVSAQSLTLTREVPGRLSAYLVAEVRPQVRGIIRQRSFAEGGTVKAGDRLYDIDDAIYRAEHESAQAALLKARATFRASQLAAKRARELLRIDAVSAQESEAADAAEAEAQAQIGVAEAALATSNVNLQYAHLVAPISGRIGKSSVTRGALVTAEQAMPLVTIQQLDPIYVEMSQSSREWLALTQDIRAGRTSAPDVSATVRILLEDGRTYPHEGRLEFTDATVDAATGSLVLRAVISNPDHLLLPGMYVRAIVTEGVVPRAVLVPQHAIAREPDGGGRALVVGKDGKVEARSVELSRAVGDRWLVERGLQPSERLVVDGLHKASPGLVVRAVEHSATERVAGHVGPVQ